MITVNKKFGYLSILAVLFICMLALTGCGGQKPSKVSNEQHVKFNEDEVVDIANNPISKDTQKTLDSLGYIGIRGILTLKSGQYNYRFIKEEVVVKEKNGEDKTKEEDLFAVGFNISNIGDNSYDTKNITLAFNTEKRKGELKALGGNTHFKLSDLIGKEPIQGAKYTVNASVNEGKILLNDPKRIMEIKVNETREDGSAKDYLIYLKLVVTKRTDSNQGMSLPADDTKEPQSVISDEQSIGTLGQEILSDLEDRAIDAFSAMFDKQYIEIKQNGCRVKFIYEVLEKPMNNDGEVVSAGSSARILGDGEFDSIDIDEDKVNQKLPIMHWMRHTNNQIGVYFLGHRLVIPDELRVKTQDHAAIEGNPGELTKDSLNLAPGRNVLINEVKINREREQVQRIYKIYLRIEEGA